MKRAILIGVAAAVLAVLPQAVHSDVLTPAGCDWIADGATWSENCWLGQNGSLYERNGELTRGVQTVLFYHSYIGISYNPISTDGFFGSQTHNRMLSFQGDHGLSVDGVVGNGTWHNLSQHMVPTISDSTWDYFKPNQNAPFNTHTRVRNSSTYWYVFSCGLWQMNSTGPVAC